MSSKRRGEITRLLQDEGTISIADLAQKLGVSLETIRRDVKPMTDTGAVTRVHGAIGLPQHLGEAPFELRMRENAGAKRLIAQWVARTIRNGESIMLDTGTTTSFLARELLQHRNLTVVTNSSDIARTLATVNGNRVFMAGGNCAVIAARLSGFLQSSLSAASASPTRSFPSGRSTLRRE